jgi:hypothetical protein
LALEAWRDFPRDIEGTIVPEEATETIPEFVGVTCGDVLGVGGGSTIM